MLGSSLVAQEYFSGYPKEAAFMRYFSDVFEITSARKWDTNHSSYSVYFLKAHDKPAQRFGLTNEVLAFYAPYPEVQARTINDIANAQQQFHDRVHPVWNILITDSLDTEQEIRQLLVGKEQEVYSIPFSRHELEQKPEASFFYQRLEEYIRGRDLFAFQSGLQSDRFFFGREKLVEEIVGLVQNGQNFGLFGLRRIGKTSVLFAVARYLEKLGGYKTIHIDCQLADFYLMRWNSLINWIASEINGEGNAIEDDYSRQGIELYQIVESSPEKVLLLFDEVEKISFDISPSKHWNDDFLHFWNSIRAVHQMSRGKLTFGVSGVNPHVFNSPLVAGQDNPILFGGSPSYLWPLDRKHTREMVRTIARYMGLQFSEEVYDWLYEQYGGHPYLVRKACSLVHDKARKSSGDTITLQEFTSREKWLDTKLGADIIKILVVLVQHYPDEFDHLLSLAKGEQDWIKYVHEEDQQALEHLLEYRIISEEDGSFSFVIQTLERLLRRSGSEMVRAISTLSNSSDPANYNRLPEPEQLELWTRVGIARNRVEPGLRLVLHRALLYKYGEQQALQVVLAQFGPTKQSRLAGFDLESIFSGESKALYLQDTKQIALSNWDLVKHIFGQDRKRFEIQLDTLNTDGRADTHANPITEQEALHVEATAEDLLKRMQPYLV